MERLTDLLNEIQPVHDGLIHIYEGLPEVTLAAERERLRQTFLDIGSKLITISQIRGTE